MEANQILKADILDIIFEGKNKLYGAYQLRKTYNKTIAKALTATTGILILFLVGTVLAGKNHTETIIKTGPEVVIGHLEDPVPPEPIKPVPPPTAAVVNSVRSVTPVIVQDNLAEKIETIEDDQVISNTTVKSENTIPIIQTPITDITTAIIEAPVAKEKEPDVYTSVEIEASFPGGFPAWKKYLETNLDAETAINNGAPEGTYTVMVNFIVSKDGVISNVNAESKVGYGLEAEAIKIIKKGPSWIAARQNGREVNAYRRQPVTFVVGGE